MTDYIVGLTKGGCPLIEESVAKRGVEFLHQVQLEFPTLPTPRIGTGDGVLGFTWESTKHHLNVELFPDGHRELFHEDLVSGALWSDDDTTSDFSSELKTKLTLFLKEEILSGR